MEAENFAPTGIWSPHRPARYTDWATTDMQYWLKLCKMNTHDLSLRGQKEEYRNFMVIINMGWSKKQNKSALY